MPNNAAVMFLVAHGAASKKGTVASMGNQYNTMFLTGVGHGIDLTSYNLVLQILISASGNSERLMESLIMIEDLPSTISVCSKHKPGPMVLPATIDLSEASTRYALLEEIKKAHTMATASPRSWDLLEHKLLPATDILGLPQALTPTNFPDKFPDFFKFTVITRSMLSEPTKPVVTLELGFNRSSILIDVKNLTSVDTPSTFLADVFRGKISDNNIVYATPAWPMGPYIPLLLSPILDNISKVHIFVTDSKAEPGTDIKIECCMLEECFATTGYPPTDPGSDKVLFDITFPTDMNIILGACRGEDDTF